MTKTELVYEVANRTGLTKKDTEKFLGGLTDALTAELRKGEKIQIQGFGTFEVNARAERQGRNPQTGEPITISASKNVKFTAGKTLKDAIK